MQTGLVLSLSSRLLSFVFSVTAIVWTAGPASAQSDRDSDTAYSRSRNVHVVGRITATDLPKAYGSSQTYPQVRFDQKPGRPFAYLANTEGFWIIDIENPGSPSIIETVRIRRASGDDVFVSDLRTAMSDGRHLVITAIRNTSAPGSDAIVVHDVTSPRTTAIREVASYTSGDTSGISRIFPYRHSSGASLIFAAGGGDILALNLAALLNGSDPLVARYPTPPLLDDRFKGFDDVYASFEPISQQDRLYGAGAGGYYVYDVTEEDTPAIVAQVSAAAVQRGTRISASPDGRYLVTAAGYRTTPVYIFDLETVLDGRQPSVRTAVGAWTANWRNRPGAFEVRWPYVFVAALHDGFHMFNMRDPEGPYTVGYLHTWGGTLPRLTERDRENEGAWGVDVRNEDGLIVLADRQSGLWLLSMDGFEGWDGRAWGMPNASTVQDWLAGPDGSTIIDR